MKTPRRMVPSRVRTLCRGAAAVGLLLSTGIAHAVAVNVVGLFPGKAIVIVDGGKPRTLAAGESVGAVKLISATSEQAVFEIEGRRRSLGMGQAANVAGAASGRPTVTLMADGAGHYLTPGAINGIPMRFLVDTGATMVSMGLADAKRLGIAYTRGERGMSTTANGTIPVYRVKLDTVKIGSIVLNQVDGLVQESDMPFVLLGMSFLNRLELKQEGPQLTMVQRF
ncbi:MAG: retroviral-like aspartic protease family protein [Burkholderiales bacterium]|nr:retroviral-like aspartic protease family protein [Burkholderiales bacterium]